MTSMQLAGLHILVVEDHALLRKFLADWLSLEGASVVAAATGEQALAVAATQEFDVVLSDLGLPDAAGDELVRTILKTARRRPRVAIITGSTKVDIAAVRAAGVDAVFPKPFDWPCLLDYLRAGRIAA